jgi:DNA-binding NarL/FixJ family response regulator
MRLAIADDHGIFRSSLRRALEDIGAHVPISVANGDALLAQLACYEIDIAIVDVAMPPANPQQGHMYHQEGLSTAQAIVQRYPGVKVLLLSADTATPQAIALLREFNSGIGYLRKDEISDAQELETILGRLLSGEQVVGRSVVERLLRSPAHESALDQLTPQEKEVLRLMAEGYSNVGIAAKLHLARRTVEDHSSRIFTKLGIGQKSDGDTNKRVLAVLTWLRHAGPEPGH